MSNYRYDPKTTVVTPAYVVKTAGDPFFIPAYPENSSNKALRLANCALLSPNGVQQVAT